MARRSFTETFAHLYDDEPFVVFLDRAYGRDGSMDRDLGDPAVRWLVAFNSPSPVGYAKLTPLRAPAPSPRPDALELQPIYLLRDWHGRGVADHLMDWALATAGAEHAPEIYLTVFDHNEHAKRFYTRYGFEEVGRCTFLSASASMMTAFGAAVFDRSRRIPSSGYQRDSFRPTGPFTILIGRWLSH